MASHLGCRPHSMNILSCSVLSALVIPRAIGNDKHTHSVHTTSSGRPSCYPHVLTLSMQVHTTPPTYLILGTFGLHFLNKVTVSRTVITARRMTIREPTIMPPISPALAAALSPVFVSPPPSVLLVLVTIVSSVVVLVSISVVMTTGGGTNGQSRALSVSSEVGQVASRCRREED